jgi:hypothetical protein
MIPIALSLKSLNCLPDQTAQRPKVANDPGVLMPTAGMSKFLNELLGNT